VAAETLAPLLVVRKRHPIYRTRFVSSRCRLFDGRDPDVTALLKKCGFPTNWLRRTERTRLGRSVGSRSISRLQPPKSTDS